MNMLILRINWIKYVIVLVNIILLIILNIVQNNVQIIIVIQF